MVTTSDPRSSGKTNLNSRTRSACCVTGCTSYLTSFAHKGEREQLSVHTIRPLADQSDVRAAVHAQFVAVFHALPLDVRLAQVGRGVDQVEERLGEVHVGDAAAPQVGLVGVVDQAAVVGRDAERRVTPVDRGGGFFARSIGLDSGQVGVEKESGHSQTFYRNLLGRA